MALKGDRQIFAETGEYRLSSAATRGYFVMANSGTVGYCKVVNAAGLAEPKAEILGCLMHDVIADASSTSPENLNKAFQVWAGGKVLIMEAGRIYTNVIHNHDSALVFGAPAYVNQSGILTNDPSSDGYTYRRVGTFESDVDSDGYVKVRFNCLRS